MAWVCLVVAGLLEIVWAVALKYAQGFTRFAPSAAFVVALGASMLLLARATRELPLGTAYGVWVGIGTLGTALCGIALFGEPATPSRIGFLSMLLVGIAGLKWTG
jgi:quaternary ammonium compound-resistance protein SugE